MLIFIFFFLQFLFLLSEQINTCSNDTDSNGDLRKTVADIVYIVFQIAVGGESELAVAYTAEFFEPFRCHVDDPKPLSGSEYILLQMPQDGGEISCADRLHVADPVAAPDLEADDQKAVHYAPGGFELELPAKHVGERQVAVRRGVRQCEGFDFGLVFDRNGFEGNHKLSSTV